MSPTRVTTLQPLSLRPIPGIGPKNIYRGVAPQAVGPAHAEQLSQLAVDTLIDLREPTEIRLDALLEIPGLRYRGIALYCGLDPADRTLGQNQRLLLDGRGARLVAAIRAIGQPTQGNTVVVCRTGGRRTGLVIALILAAIGVPRELIIADFAAAFASQEQGTSDQAAQAMNDTLDWLVDGYGSVAGYLLSKGLTGAELQLLRELRGEQSPRILQPLVAS